MRVGRCMIRMIFNFTLPSIIAGIVIILAIKIPLYSPIFMIVGSIIMLYAISRCGKSADKYLKGEK